MNGNSATFGFSIELGSEIVGKALGSERAYLAADPSAASQENRDRNQPAPSSDEGDPAVGKPVLVRGGVSGASVRWAGRLGAGPNELRSVAMRAAGDIHALVRLQGRPAYQREQAQPFGRGPHREDENWLTASWRHCTCEDNRAAVWALRAEKSKWSLSGYGRERHRRRNSVEGTVHLCPQSCAIHRYELRIERTNPVTLDNRTGCESTTDIVRGVRVRAGAGDARSAEAIDEALGIVSVNQPSQFGAKTRELIFRHLGLNMRRAENAYGETARQRQQRELGYPLFSDAHGHGLYLLHRHPGATVRDGTRQKAISDQDHRSGARVLPPQA